MQRSRSQVLFRRCWNRRSLTVLALGGLGFVYTLFFLGESGAFDLALTTEERRWLTVAAGVFIAFEYPRARWSLRREFVALGPWLDDPSSHPSAEDVERLDHLPRQQALSVLLEWTAAVVIALTIHTQYTSDLGQTVVLAIGGMVLGFHMAWLVLLLVESALREAFVLADEAGAALPVERRLASRLFLTLLLSGGLVVFGVVLVVAWPGAHRADVARAVIPLAGFILVEGGAFVFWALRSLDRSIEALRAGLAQVEEGDLSSRVDVDDRTEIGSLQRSFNSMVDGLRDREVLERLLAGQVGRGVAEVSRATGSRVAGERRRVTVLFVDMIGSTTLAERVPPESVFTLLNEFFDVVVRVVDESGGEVLQFQGDGAVCLFGAPSPIPDHAGRALGAARAMQREIEEFATTHPGFEAAVAVATGAVVVGHVGSEVRHTYTAIGDAANEASRLVEQAKAVDGRVLATEAAIESAGDPERARWQPSGAITLRGRRGLTHTWAPADGRDGALETERVSVER